MSAASAPFQPKADANRITLAITNPASCEMSGWRAITAPMTTKQSAAIHAARSRESGNRNGQDERCGVELNRACANPAEDAFLTRADNAEANDDHRDHDGADRRTSRARR